MKRTINCGDWHLGWGFGGSDKIGRLSSEDGINFTWKGYSQGRHGQTWNKGAKCTFTLGKNNKFDSFETVKGSCPRLTELLKSALELKAKFK